MRNEKSDGVRSSDGHQDIIIELNWIYMYVYVVMNCIEDSFIRWSSLGLFESIVRWDLVKIRRAQRMHYSLDEAYRDHGGLSHIQRRISVLD